MQALNTLRQSAKVRALFTFEVTVLNANKLSEVPTTNALPVKEKQTSVSLYTRSGPTLLTLQVEERKADEKKMG